MAALEDDGPVFKQALVQEMFKLTLDPQTRASPAAVHLSSEYLRLFTREAIHRAAEVAKLEHDAQGGVIGPVLIEVRNLEKIVAGLLLDF